jgi:putative membrane protein
MKLLFLACCLTAGFVACSDDDNNNTSPTLSQRDQTFMTMASYGNLSEIAMGKVADSISTDDSVKMFGQMMMTDHGTAQAELQTMGMTWSMNLPTGPDSMHLAKKQQLMGMTGYMFDTAYIASQIKDHQTTIALFQMAIDSSNQQQLKSYAAKYLPAIKMHLAKADSIMLMLQQHPH